MSINLSNFEEQARSAVKYFWQTRASAAAMQVTRGKADQGERAAVTAGKHMDGFAHLMDTVALANGLPQSSIFRNASLLVLPGFFRPTKRWDFLIVYQERLVAALELKSHVGAFRNFNNRCEEVLGTATDLWTAFREGAFRQSPRPFVGYLTLVEDDPAVHTSVPEASAHFPIFPEFIGASYAQRYELLCRKLMQERLYDAACLMLSPRDAGLQNGAYREVSDTTGLRRFVAGLAGHVAAIAAMG
jgi:hypothetical protein